MTRPREVDPYDVPDLPPVEIVAADLQRIGNRRRRDADTLRRLIPTAVAAGMSEAEAARRSGMSRSYVRKLLGKTP